ncbi:3-deoxy-7-phosphoheptulonate synthase, partial [Candidatus Peregrinibacteria bacterium]|nr:3-deoxy-7-phosphoheptulonate synthase [Candidatus Peregrinibacteria bacterium]
MNSKINNLRVASFGEIASPAKVMRQAKITKHAAATVLKARENLQNILDGKDSRKIIIVGPCSIHDAKSALEYAEKLNQLRKKMEDKFVIVMRAYFEKPRTTVGWKGFIYDPYLDDSYSLKEGVVLARKLLIKINDMGLPTGTEVLGPIVIQYYSDLICWSAIGARTAESQTHRELASGLSMPVGFKNGTEGNVDIAVNAILSAEASHSFLGMDDEGKVSVVGTTGNPYGHIILRGGNKGPNYSADDVARAVNFCKKAGVKPRILIDCSHANSEKDYRNQAKVWHDVIGQMKKGSNISGLMLESNLSEGSQKIGGGWGEMKYGVSITD